MKIITHCPKYLWLVALICNLSIIGKGQQSDNIGLKEVDKMDYVVYNSFFTTEKLPAIELPQFFGYVAKARKIYGNTVIAKELKPKELVFFNQSFGESFNCIYEDFRKNNKVEYLVKDGIMTPDLTILSKEQKEKMLSGRLVEVPSHLTGEYVSLSRVGFNKEGDRALLHITWNGSAVSSYYVMMQKQDNKWEMINVEMDNMIIF
jgi:hypothetical protein